MSGSRASAASPFECPRSPPLEALKSTRKRNSRTSTAVIRSGRGSASGHHRRQPATGDGQPHRIRGGGPKEYGRFGYRIAAAARAVRRGLDRVVRQHGRGSVGAAANGAGAKALRDAAGGGSTYRSAGGPVLRGVLQRRPLAALSLSA